MSPLDVMTGTEIAAMRHRAHWVTRILELEHGLRCGYASDFWRRQSELELTGLRAKMAQELPALIEFLEKLKP